MNKNLDALQTLPLFRNISTEGLQTMMDCFSGEFFSLKKGEATKYKKNSVICLITGEINGLKQGCFVPMPPEESPLFATENSLVLLLERHMLLYPCYGCCFFHAQLLQNMREDGIDLKTLEDE